MGLTASGGMQTGIGLCSVANPDLHSVMLMAELGFIAAQPSVMRIAARWKANIFNLRMANSFDCTLTQCDGKSWRL